MSRNRTNMSFQAQLAAAREDIKNHETPKESAAYAEYKATEAKKKEKKQQTKKRNGANVGNKGKNGSPYNQPTTSKPKSKKSKTEERKEQYRTVISYIMPKLFKQDRLVDYLRAFLAGYKHNSGIFINNFFRERDYDTYCKDKFHDFSYDFGVFPSNDFGDFEHELGMVRLLRLLEEEKNAYLPIDIGFIDYLVALSQFFEHQDGLAEDTILYRGCSTIERNGVNGIVSTTKDRRIAEQFSRGTILIIHAPKGAKFLEPRILRKPSKMKEDTEDEYILPPCDYEVLNRYKIEKRDEPNNRQNYTEIIEIKITPLDLLEEFYKVMENPPQEFVKKYLDSNGEEAMQFYAARDYLKDILDNRNYQRRKDEPYQKYKDPNRPN